MDTEEKNLEANELKEPLNSDSTSNQDFNSQVAPQKCQCWHKLSPVTKTILILFLCFIGFICISFSTCLGGRDIKTCPLPNYR